MLRKKPKQYAAALFALAKKHDIFDELHESLKYLSTLYEENSLFRLFFYSVKVLPEKKVSILASILGDRVHRIGLEFLGILAEKKEHELLRATVSAFVRLYQSQMKVEAVTATTATPLEEAGYRQVLQKLEVLFGKQVEMKIDIDPRLIGGVKLRIGNTLLDGSIVRQIEKMKQSLLLRTYHG